MTAQVARKPCGGGYFRAAQPACDDIVSHAVTILPARRSVAVAIDNGHERSFRDAYPGPRILGDRDHHDCLRGHAGPRPTRPLRRIATAHGCGLHRAGKRGRGLARSAHRRGRMGRPTRAGVNVFLTTHLTPKLRRDRIATHGGGNAKTRDRRQICDVRCAERPRGRGTRQQAISITGDFKWFGARGRRFIAGRGAAWARAGSAEQQRRSLAGPGFASCRSAPAPRGVFQDLARAGQLGADRIAAVCRRSQAVRNRDWRSASDGGVRDPAGGSGPVRGLHRAMREPRAIAHDALASLSTLIDDFSFLRVGV